jgi:hypothetical protein
MPTGRNTDGKRIPTGENADWEEIVTEGNSTEGNSDWGKCQLKKNAGWGMPTGGNADWRKCQLKRIPTGRYTDLGECRQNNHRTLDQRSRPGPLSFPARIQISFTF